MAARRGHTQTVELLLSKGAEVEAQDNDVGTMQRLDCAAHMPTICQPWHSTIRSMLCHNCFACKWIKASDILLKSCVSEQSPRLAGEPVDVSGCRALSIV